MVGSVAKTAFNVFRERRRAHDGETREIQAELDAVDSDKYARILKEIADPLVSVSEEDEKWFEETGELIETLNERARVEEEEWKVAHGLYVASIQTSGTRPAYYPLASDVSGRDFYTDDNGKDKPLGNASLTEITKYQEESSVFRRLAEESRQTAS